MGVFPPAELPQKYKIVEIVPEFLDHAGILMPEKNERIEDRVFGWFWSVLLLYLNQTPPGLVWRWIQGVLK